MMPRRVMSEAVISAPPQPSGALIIAAPPQPSFTRVNHYNPVLAVAESVEAGRFRSVSEKRTNTVVCMRMHA